ncbi:hypothetical protein ABW20_dc0108840 [Dactylellina cionopaga]|nr:hypothetical protein ABW20_dc0108840 [Dactylellina cionopaga]
MLPGNPTASDPTSDPVSRPSDLNPLFRQNPSPLGRYLSGPLAYQATLSSSFPTSIAPPERPDLGDAGAGGAEEPDDGSEEAVEDVLDVNEVEDGILVESALLDDVLGVAKMLVRLEDDLNDDEDEDVDNSDGEDLGIELVADGGLELEE